MSVRTRIQKLEAESPTEQTEQDQDEDLLQALDLATKAAQVGPQTHEILSRDGQAGDRARSWLDDLLRGFICEGRPPLMHDEITLPLVKLNPDARLGDPDKLGFRWDCEECGLLIPTRDASRRMEGSSNSWTVHPAYNVPVVGRCPACGGRVAPSGYYVKHECYPSWSRRPLALESAEAALAEWA